MKRAQVKGIYREYWSRIEYQLVNWQDWDYSHLKKIMWERPAGRGQKKPFNDIIIGIDTETSKTKLNKKNPDGSWIPVPNIIVSWTISLRAYERNLVTLWGRRPDDMISCMDKINKTLPGKRTIIYCHNYSYDYQFLRLFMFSAWGHPKSQLNTKSHYPIHMEWANGIQIRDSLILAQRKLEKWAVDMDVEHQKAMGSWDYDKLRTQSTTLSTAELHYMENDTLALVECLDATRIMLHKHVYSMPYTATGIPREEVRKKGKMHNAHERFLSRALTVEEQHKMEDTYHGGFTHANRHYINQLIDYEPIIAYDFASSYPYVMLSEKMPMEKFSPLNKPLYMDDILKLKDKYAIMFTLIARDVRVKDDFVAMPYLQMSKCYKTVNAIPDNGRILKAAYVEIPLTETDLEIIADQYIFGSHVCIDVESAMKDYLPDWYRDYVFQCCTDKTKLKGGDPVAYNIAKGKVNSLYGMCCQKPVKDDIEEDYDTGEYIVQETDYAKVYAKYIKKHGTVLSYQWGTWITAYAARNLFDLGKCVSPSGIWLYSDTDSCYATGWDSDRLEDYNRRTKQKLIDAGYGPVLHNGREYWLGVAEKDGEYSEFKTQGAKRYCCRDAQTGQLKITVAGVPKKNGAKCLNDDINNFTTGFIFAGDITGKLTHYYLFAEDIYLDSAGNICGDSVDLCPCDYKLDSVYAIPWEDLLTEDIEIQVYEED